MKNKKLTYALIFIVLAVWGMIIYRVIASADPGDGASPVFTAKMKKDPYNDYTIPKDTTHLLLNYRNPFGVQKQPDTAEVPLKKLIHKTIGVAPVKPAMNWNFIQYLGYIHNSSSRKLIALLAINGKNVTLKEGETADKVRLMKNMRDSVRISFNGQIKCIRLKTAP
ncbi:MAG: hypothetical protein JWP94_472 [Mucilaginibacter sp.]|nr:hypothetical protein [Mucilaginibacter sp.]